MSRINHRDRIAQFVRDTRGAKAGDKITILGIPVNVVSEAEAEECDVVVCMRGDASQSAIPAINDRCADCGCAIYYSHSAPVKPRKICMECCGKYSQPVGPSEVLH